MKQSINLFLPIKKYEISNFAKKITTPWDYAYVLFTVIRHFIIFKENICDSTSSNEYLKISMNRLYEVNRIFIYIGENKYVSFTHSFSYSDGVFRFREIIIDAKLVSEIFSIINQRNLDEPLYSVYIANGNNDCPASESAFKVLESVLMSEYGYVRHDDDAQAEAKASDRLIHPRFHFDINFTKNATFKIGTYQMLDKKTYESVFNKSKKCLFLGVYNAISSNSLKWDNRKTSKRKGRRSK